MSLDELWRGRSEGSRSPENSGNKDFIEDAARVLAANATAYDDLLAEKKAVDEDEAGELQEIYDLSADDMEQARIRAAQLIEEKRNGSNGKH